MPVTARGESFAPAELSQQVTPLEPGTPTGRRRLDLATHFAPGTLWRAAYAVAAAKGLRGQAAVNRVFAVVCTGDVLLNTALGLYAPRQWSTQDWVVHLVDTYVQAQGTGLVFDRALDPAC